MYVCIYIYIYIVLVLEAIANSLKMMKNTFYFMLEAFFVIEIFSFLSQLLRYVEKRLYKVDIVNYKIYGITGCTENNSNTHITQCLKKKGNQAMEFGQLIEHSVRNFLFKIHAKKEVGRLVPLLFSFF